MTTASVLFKTRRVLDDMGEMFTAQLAGDGTTMAFELPTDKIDQTAAFEVSDTGGSPQALVNGVDYIIDPYNSIITTTVPVPTGTVLVVSGMSYTSWADTDMLDYITEALGLHNISRNPPVVLDPVIGANPPTEVVPLIEERAVALLSASMVINDQATAAAKDITIDTGDGTVIPRAQRYEQLVGEAARLEEEYVSLVEKLGIPSFATVSITTLRRVSMTTNRLVPIYTAREWDDRTYPKRVLPLIPSGGLEADMVVNYRGLWSPYVSYNLYDLVDRSSSRYLCTTPNTGVDPTGNVAAGGTNGVDGINGTDWSLSYINSGNFGWMAGGW